MRKFFSLIIAMCIALIFALSLSACANDGAGSPPETPPPSPPPAGPPPHTHTYALNTYLVAEGKAYKVRICNCEEYEIVEEVAGAIIASPQTLVELVGSASDNSTIVLDGGTYSTLYLEGKDAYPQNLTVIGTKDAVLNGVSITSGVKYEKVVADSLNSSINDEQMEGEATLNGNLTFRNITFGRTVAIRNASIDGFSLYDCKFTNCSGLAINSNTFCNYYGNDTNSGNKINITRSDYCVLYTKNVRVQNCSFRNVDYSGSQQDTAIIVHSVENITIKNCVVDGSSFNAVQINGISNAKSKGAIVLDSNTFKYTDDRLLRFNAIDSEANITLKFNILEGSGNPNEVMKAPSAIRDCFNFIDNTYAGYMIDKNSSSVVFG